MRCARVLPRRRAPRVCARCRRRGRPPARWCCACAPAASAAAICTGFTGGSPPPSVCPGHEIAGEVVACGAGVAGVRGGRAGHGRADGDLRRLPLLPRRHAAALPQPAASPACIARAGSPSWWRCRRRCSYPLPAELDWAVGGAERADRGVPCTPCGSRRSALGERVLILGAGSIGLLAVARGARRGRRRGADHRPPCAPGRDGAPTRRRRASSRPTADADDERRALAARSRRRRRARDASAASPIRSPTPCSCVRPGGTVVLLGVFTAPPSLPATDAPGEGGPADRLDDVRPRRARAPTSRSAIDLLVAHRDAVAPLVTHRVALADVQPAFETAADKRSGAIKVSVLP